MIFQVEIEADAIIKRRSIMFTTKKRFPNLIRILKVPDEVSVDLLWPREIP